MNRPNELLSSINVAVTQYTSINVAVTRYRGSLSESIKSMIRLAFSIMEYLFLTSEDGPEDWKNLRNQVIKPVFERHYPTESTRAARLSEFSSKLLKVIKFFKANEITPTQMAEDDLVNVIEDVFATKGNFIDRYHL